MFAGEGQSGGRSRGGGRASVRLKSGSGDKGLEVGGDVGRRR